ncbi:hypothetical protein I317_01644 [Kwoniella heveanensis CBS 569]|nr:hypothetical protein I317_01644 [Kwoniella heveanensis CBS 569]
MEAVQQERKMLFAGVIMYVETADASEKFAVEQYLLKEAGAAVIAFASAAHYIIAPRSVDAYHLAEDLGPKAGARVIRLGWVQNSIAQGFRDSRSKYCGRARPSEAKQGQQVPPQTQHMLGSAISRVPHTNKLAVDMRPKSEDHLECHPTVLELDSTPTHARTQRADLADNVKTAEGPAAPPFTPPRSGTFSGQVSPPPEYDSASPSPVPPAPAPGSLLAANAYPPTSISSSISPWGNVRATTERWRPPKLSSSYVPRQPQLYSGGAGQSTTTPDDPLRRMQAKFIPRPVASQSAFIGWNGLSQFWYLQTFCIVGNEASKADIKRKIEDHGGIITDSLVEASRVIFIRPTETCDHIAMEILFEEAVRLNDNEEENEGRPCMTIAEGWIHNSYKNDKPKRWGDFKIRRTHWLYDDKFRERTRVGARDFEDYERQKKAPTALVLEVAVAPPIAVAPSDHTETLAARMSEESRQTIASQHHLKPVEVLDLGKTDDDTHVPEAPSTPKQIQGKVAPSQASRMTAPTRPSSSLPGLLGRTMAILQQTSTGVDSPPAPVECISPGPKPQDPRLVKRQLEQSASATALTPTRDEMRYPTPVSPPLPPVPCTPVRGIAQLSTKPAASTNSLSVLVSNASPPNMVFDISGSSPPPKVEVVDISRSSSPPRPASPVVVDEDEDDYDDLAGLLSDEEEGEADYDNDDDQEDGDETMRMEDGNTPVVRCSSVSDNDVHRAKIAEDMQRMNITPKKPRVLPSFKKKRKSGDEGSLDPTEVGTDININPNGIEREDPSKKLKRAPTKLLTRVLPADKKEFDELDLALRVRVNGKGFPEGGMYEFARSIGKILTRGS